MSLFIDIHALQTVPPSNMNRDDLGAPKTATFGGVPRHRVSSQSWKRAIRKDFGNRLDSSKLGVRTRFIVDAIAQRLKDKGAHWDYERIDKDVRAAYKSAGIKTDVVVKPKEDDEKDSKEFNRAGYLVFLSNKQLDNLTDVLIEADGRKLTRKEALDILDVDHSVDLAMFGRMIADDPAMNVDASVQVAHALGVHASEPESDYFTAVDDFSESEEEAGAGMIGTVQMMSSTLYRFATINVEQLQTNLRDADVTKEGVRAFIESFINSIPGGKLNTFANFTVPDLIIVSVRDDRPVSFVNAFETAIEGEVAGGRRLAAAKNLQTEVALVNEQYGQPALKTFVVTSDALADEVAGVGERVKLPELLDGVAEILDSTEWEEK